MGSYLEQYQNRVTILKLVEERKVLEEDHVASFDHPFPPTHVAFLPGDSASRPDLLATSGDVIRIWIIEDGQPTEMRVVMKDTAISNRGTVTCFDWNDLDPKAIISGSTSGILTSWDVELGLPKTRVQMHDGDVFDCQWGAVDVVASSSSDASVRLLDLRDDQSCMILLESENKSPIVRLDWNKVDPRYMAMTTAHDPKVLVLDIRRPNEPLLELDQHLKVCNAIQWSGIAPGCICTAGDDGNALIWNLGNLQAVKPGAKVNPDLMHRSGAPINQICWSPMSPNWLATTSTNTTRVMRV